uniref:Peroxisomal membrane protein MPV17 n=1 Tax=Trieres chinensis TaxID=1514140 RepID=A0A7S1Z6U1_TRICV
MAPVRFCIVASLLAAVTASRSAFVPTRRCGTSTPRTAFKQHGSALSLTLDSIEVDPVLIEHIATGGALALAGDVIAQSLTSEKSASDSEGGLNIPPEDWDKVRTAAFVVFGALYTGGVQHFIFGFLNATFDNPIKRLLLAQFFFIPFCYYPTFLFMVPTLRAGWEAGGDFASPEAVERRESLFTEVFGKIPSTLLRNWCFWLPVQFVQFSFVPTDLQVTYCAAFGVIWNAILSWSTSSTQEAKTEASK